MARPEILIAALALATGCAQASPPSVPAGSYVPYVPHAPSAPTPAPAEIAAAKAPPSATAPSPPRAAEPPREVTAAPATIVLSKDPLASQLLASGGAALRTVLASPEKYRFQVVYGVVHEARPGAPASLERHPYRADAEYFFPASSMKMPIALAAYERLALLRAGGKPALTRDATLRVYPLSGSGEPYVTSIARETWRSLIVSDNFSANRMIAIVGHREAHEALWSLGLSSARVRAGFATGADVSPAELSPRIEITGGGELAARRSDLALPPNDAVDLDLGRAHIAADGRRVDAPLSFADKNAMRIVHLQDTLVRITRPDLLPAGSARDTGSSDDLAYLRQALGTLPSESGLAGFERNVVADYQLVPFLRGIERVRPRGRFQIFSKVGQAYGFLVANAYVVDKDTGRAFFLVASIYANPNETMNDDNYAYDAVSFPALADVGEIFARHAFGAAQPSRK
ncbi:MAG: serine hydrolase [Labilithrix sp.]|nr:serine hydrolase [Labilithrix sp.]